MAPNPDNQGVAKSRLFFSFLTGVTFLSFLPAFLRHFGFHSDYSLMASGPGREMIKFVQWDLLIQTGRPVSAVLTTLMSWTVDSTSDFLWWRFLGFAVLIILAGLFTRFFGQRLGFSPFWSALLAFSLIALPAAQLTVIWLLEIVPVSLAVLMAWGAYMLLDKSSGERKGFLKAEYLICAFLIFVASLAAYPPSAMFVFYFTFCSVLGAPPEAGRAVGLRVLRDMVFFGAGMLAYFLLIFLTVTLPGVRAGAEFTKTQDTVYQVALTASPWEKMPLLFDTLAASMAGPWHMVMGNSGAALTLAVLVFLVFALIVQDRRGKKTMPLKVHARFWGVLVFLFIVVNLPTLVSKGNNILLGYRVLWPASALWITMMFALFVLWELTLTAEKAKRAVRVFALVLFFSFVGINAYTVDGAARQAVKEMEYIRSRVSSMEPENLRKVVFLYPGSHQRMFLIERPLPFEFNYLITSVDDLGLLVGKFVGEQKQEVLQYQSVKDVPGAAVVYDDQTLLIDRREAKITKGAEAGAERIFVDVSANAVPRPALAFPGVQDIQGGKVLSLLFYGEEDAGYLWVPPGPGAPFWIEMVFETSPRAVRAVQAAGYGADQQRQNAPLEFFITAGDGTEMQRLRENPAARKGFVTMADPSPHRKYRLNFTVKDGPPAAAKLLRMTVVY